MKHEQDKRKELLKKWKELPEPKDSWETFKRKSQTFKEYYEEQDIIRGTWTDTETDLTVNINGKQDTISTVDRDGTPRPVNMIRTRVQMERLLRKMGVDVEAPGAQGKYKVEILWPEKYGSQYKGREIGEVKLVPQKDPILR